MSDEEGAAVGLWCPSARPDQPDAVVFGVRTATDAGSRIGYLSSKVPVTQEVLQMAEPAGSLNVFRVAAPCAEDGCVHFADNECALAGRIVRHTPVVVSIAPACALRSSCRWFAQEGTAACRRCPQIVTSESGANVEVALAATPAGVLSAGVPPAGEG